MSANSPAGKPAPAVDPFIANPAGEVDRGLKIAGFGWYTFKLCVISYMALLSSLMEMIGASLILPAAKCDLNMSDQARGFVSAIPYIGVILTSYVLGYLSDTVGRRQVLVCTTLLTGCFSFLAALMPNLITFMICKFLSALCIGGPSAIPFAYVAEVVAPRHRDISLAMANVFQTIGATLIPFLAWAVIPLDFRINFGVYVFRPWRLLTMIYASFILVTSWALFFVPASPKFSLSQGNADDALKVMGKMYVGNQKKPLETYPIKRLPIPEVMEHENLLQSVKSHTLPLLEWKYFKYLLLNGMLLYGIYFILNGIHMWVPDLVNRVFSGGDVYDKKACQIITEGFKNKKQDAKCDDSIHPFVYQVNGISLLVCAVIAGPVALAINYIGKKVLVLVTYFLMGALIILVNHIKETMVFTIIMSSFPLMALSIGCVNAFSVEIFPTFFRSMAICLSMMLGRLGGISANMLTGSLIAVACEAMFYMFGGLLISSL